MKFLIIITIVIFFIGLKKINYYENFDNNNYAVLLTTCIKPAIVSSQNNLIERKKTYENAIHQWMEKTNLLIYIIESSNMGFPEIEEKYKHTNRLKIIKYDQTKFNCDYEPGICRGVYEAYSMKYALEHMPKYEYIFKITGRYYLDGVENDLTKIMKSNNKKDGYFQIHKTEITQNSEYYFIKSVKLLELCNNIINNIDKKMIFEEFLNETKKNIDYSTVGPYPNNVSRGGDGVIVNPL